MDKVIIAICDDQEIAVNKLKNMIEQYCQKVGYEVSILPFFEGKSVLEQREKIDILFLDIEMPEIDGIEVGEHFRKRNKNCKIIMATAREDRFKEAFKINAYRFVSKPYNMEEIGEALESCYKTFVGKEKIQLYEKRVVYEVCQKDISYIRAYNSYVEAKVGNHIMRKDSSLNKIEEILNIQLFYKVNKAYVINLMKVEDYKNGKIFIDGQEISVPRRKRKKFEIAFQKFDLEFWG